MAKNQYEKALENGLAGQSVQETYECECPDKKKYRVIFDGASIGKYAIKYCQKCYDSDDKQFMISEELIQ